jgi:hypothetical protein
MAEPTPATTSDDDQMAAPHCDSPTDQHVSMDDERDSPTTLQQHPEAPAAPPSSAEPLVDIQLDRNIPAEWIRNRRDVVISGLVVAEQPIEAVSLVVKDEVKAVALYGRAESRQVFRLTLAERQDLARGLTPFVVSARTRDGQEHDVPFRIVTDPDDPRAARVIKGAVCELSLSMKARIPILLDVEMAAVDKNNVLHVRGWATALTQIMTVQVIFDEHVVSAPHVSQMRDDIAAAYPRSSNARLSGFSLSEVLPAGKAPLSIAVEAIDLGGSVSRVVVPLESNASLPQPLVPDEVAPPLPRAQPEQDPRRAIFAHCDAATLSTDGQLLVAGWVVCATGISTVEVRLDGEAVGEAELGLPQPPNVAPVNAVDAAEPPEVPGPIHDVAVLATGEPQEFEPAQVIDAAGSSETFSQPAEVPASDRAPDSGTEQVTAVAPLRQASSQCARSAGEDPREVGPGHVSVQAVASETPGERAQVDLTASEEPPAFDSDHVLAEASPSDTPIPSALYDVPAPGEPSQFEADYAEVAATPLESPSPSAAVDPLPAEDPPEVAQQPVVAAANAWEAPRASIKVHRLPSGELLEFDERWYLLQNPGVAAAVRRGDFKSGLAHYLEFGRDEGRSPVPPVHAS